MKVAIFNNTSTNMGNQLRESESFLEAYSHPLGQEKSLLFMDLEGLLQSPPMGPILGKLNQEVVSFLSDFATKMLHAFFISPMRATCPAHLSPPPWFDHYSNIPLPVQTMKLLIMQFFSSTCYFLTSKI
jgi:hypothetical protein